VITIPECDDVANANGRPGMNGRVVESELDLLIFLVKAYFGENCRSESKMWPLEPALNLKYSRLNIILPKHVIVSTKTT
jgi:hypothetical protein